MTVEMKYGTLNEVVPSAAGLLPVGIKYGTLNEVANPVVDEESWNAVYVQVAELAGNIKRVFIRHVETNDIYNNSAFPLTLPFGDHVEVAGSAENTGGATETLRLTVDLLDPDGVKRAHAFGYLELAPGGSLSISLSSPAPLDKGGTWVIHATLEAE